MSDTRIEKDSLGEIEVPAGAYYGAQTERARRNFPVSGLRLPKRFIAAVAMIKGEAAVVNEGLGLVPGDIAHAIRQAADEVVAGRLDDQFPLDIFQTGSATSTNMNVNEVLSNRAIEILGGQIGSKKVHPNDHVNASQSSNDVIPSAIHVSSYLAIQEELEPGLQKLAGALQRKAGELDDVVKIGPVVVRPSYVLGGRAMAIVYDEATLARYMREAADVSPGHPILIDRFLEDAFELDVDLIADGRRAVIAGVLQHIEEAGIHSGDSAAVLPPYRVTQADQDVMRDIARRLALRLGVVGLMNVQFALKDGRIYVLEVNPRASRTVPFIAKAVGLPLVKIAVRAMAGKTLEELGFTEEPEVPGVFVKAPVFPFRRFPGTDPVLGPEMKSTGEVMGVSGAFGNAFAKAWLGAGHKLPLKGTAFLSVHDRDKPSLLPIARRLAELGFELAATAGTAAFLEQNSLTVRTMLKVHEGRPHVVDHLINDDIDLVINTPLGRASHEDDSTIRRAALKHDIPCITTLSGATAAAEGIAALQKDGLSVRPLQEIHQGVAQSSFSWSQTRTMAK